MGDTVRLGEVVLSLQPAARDRRSSTGRALRPKRTRLGILALAALLAPLAVVAIWTVGFVVLVADTFGRTVIAPSQLPAGLIIALVGAPNFVWLLRRTHD